MKELIEGHKWYTAGIVDGEGTICITKGTNKRGKEPAYGLFCVVTNTNIILPKWLLAKTGIGKVSLKTRNGANIHKWKPAYQWVLRTDEIAKFLPQILPYLLLKQRQAELMLEFIGAKRAVSSFSPLTMEESVLKQLIFEEMAELNKRGPA